MILIPIVQSVIQKNINNYFCISKVKTVFSKISLLKSLKKSKLVLMVIFNLVCLSPYKTRGFYPLIQSINQLKGIKTTRFPKLKQLPYFSH